MSNEQQQQAKKEDDGDWGKAFTRQFQKTISSIFDNNNNNKEKEDDNNADDNSDDNDSGISITSSTKSAAQLVLSHAISATATTEDSALNDLTSLETRQKVAQAELSRNAALEEVERAKGVYGDVVVPLQEDESSSKKQGGGERTPPRSERQLLPPQSLLLGDDLINDAIVNDPKKNNENEMDVVDRIFNEQDEDDNDPLYETGSLFRDYHGSSQSNSSAISSSSARIREERDAAAEAQLLQQISATNSADADDYTEGSAWTDDPDSSSMYSSPSEFGSPVPGSPLHGSGGLIFHIGTIANYSDEEELFDEEELLPPDAPTLVLEGGGNNNGRTTAHGNNSTKGVTRDEDARMSIIEEAGENDDNYINSILKPPGQPEARQKRERSLVILVVTLIGLSIVIGATVGGVLGSRDGGIDDLVEEKSAPPTVTPVTTSFFPSSFPTPSPLPPSGGVVVPPPTTIPIMNNTTSPSASPTRLSSPSPSTAPTTIPTIFYSSSPSTNPTGVSPSPSTTPSTNSTTGTTTSSSPTTTCYNIDIIINYDSYPNDTSWTITQLLPPSPTNETIIVDESPFKDPNQSRKVCLQRGFYNFTIFDDYGDGLCCEWGIGNYTLVYQGSDGEEDEVIASGAAFNASESTSFSIGYIVPST